MPGCIILSLKARLKKTKRDPCVLQMQNCKTKQRVSVKRNWLLFCSCLCFFIIQIKRNAYGGERGKWRARFVCAVFYGRPGFVPVWHASNDKIAFSVVKQQTAKKAVCLNEKQNSRRTFGCMHDGAYAIVLCRNGYVGGSCQCGDPYAV